MIILFDGSSAGSCYRISEESAGQTSARFIYKGSAGKDYSGMKGSSVAVYPFDEDSSSGFQQRIQCPGQGCFRKGIEPEDVQQKKISSYYPSYTEQ